MGAIVNRFYISLFAFIAIVSACTTKSMDNPAEQTVTNSIVHWFGNAWQNIKDQLNEVDPAIEQLKAMRAEFNELRANPANPANKGLMDKLGSRINRLESQIIAKRKTVEDEAKHNAEKYIGR